MARKRGDDAHESVMFESVGIGPAGGEPVEFVPVDVVAPPPPEHHTGRNWGIAVVAVVLAVFAAVVWVTTRPTTPDAVEDWQVRIPTDPTEAFVWRVPDGDEPQVWAAGTADHPYVMAVGPESGTIYALDDSGHERWQASIGGGSYAEAYPHEGTVITVTQGPDRYGDSTDDPAQVVVTAVATDDGHRVWQTSATGDYSTAIDGHIVVFDFPDDAFLIDGEDPSDLPVTTITSIDLTSGERGPTKRYDQVISDWVGNELLVKLDGKVVQVDGALNPIGTPVPTGDAAAGSDGERILTLGDGKVTVYDTDGAVIRSASKLPDELAGDAYWSVGGFGGFGADVWIFVTSSDGPDCGAFRYGAGDDAPVLLWRSDDCVIYAPPGISRQETADADVARYALRWSTTDALGTELIDMVTGSVVAAGDSLALATNGFVVSDGEQLVGRALGDDGPGDSLFSIADAAEDWHLLVDAVAIAHRSDGGEVDYVTFYRDEASNQS